MGIKVTQALAQYVADAKYDHFPSAVVEKAKLLIMDSVGCALGGYATDTGKVLTSFGREMSDKAEAAMIGDGTRISCMFAAGVNAQMANILNFDDTTVTGHPGSAIVQTAIALGQRLGVGGREIIEGVVIGYEVTDRIGAAAPTHSPRTRTTAHAIPVSQHVFGPAAVAAKMLHLDAEQANHALGIGGAIPPMFNLKRITSKPASPTKVGNLWNCFTGMSAAFLARGGFGGPADYLDGPMGYWALVADEVDYDAAVQGLGSHYMTEEVQIKPWATCRFNSAPIQLVGEIMKEERIRLEDIEGITVRTNVRAAGKPFTERRPTEMFDAFYSTPWAIAMAALGYQSGQDWYEPEKFSDPAIHAVADKVSLEIHPEAERILKERGIAKSAPCEIEVRAGGRAFTRWGDGAKGDSDQPMNAEEVSAKFASLAARCMDSRRIHELTDVLASLERVRTAQLAELLKAA